MINPDAHIEGFIIRFIISFIKHSKRDRYQTLFKSANGKAKLFINLYHMKDFDEKYVIEIPPVSQNASDVYKILLNYGAPEICYVISDNKDLNEKECNLKNTLEEVTGSGFMALISCLPGRLVFYEGEDNRLILLR